MLLRNPQSQKLSDFPTTVSKRTTSCQVTRALVQVSALPLAHLWPPGSSRAFLTQWPHLQTWNSCRMPCEGTWMVDKGARAQQVFSKPFQNPGRNPGFSDRLSQLPFLLDAHFSPLFSCLYCNRNLRRSNWPGLGCGPPPHGQLGSSGQQPTKLYQTETGQHLYKGRSAFQFIISPHVLLKPAVTCGVLLLLS